MPGLLDRSIDRELGIESEAVTASRRESWLRDWPLLLGLVVSAGLIAASTTVGDPHAAPPEAAPARKAADAAGAVPGPVVDVGEGQPAPEKKAPATTGTARHTRSTPAKPPHKKSASADHTADPAPTADAGAAPSTTPSARSRKRSPARSNSTGGTSGTGPATHGRIVNVTGTSAAFANGPVSYAFTAPTHTPTVGKPWRLTIAVKRSGAPLRGSVKVDILHDGAVVGHAASGKLSGGRFTHDFDWPDQSAGYPLVVKTTVVGGGFQQSFLFGVKVRKAG